MSEEPADHEKKQDVFARKIARKEARKIEARRREKRNIWFGLGMMGVVGWSVAIPTLIALAVGIWLDKRFPGEMSFTLMFLTIGVAIGCLNAWFWVQRESRHE